MHVRERRARPPPGRDPDRGHAPARRRRHDLEVRRVHRATGADRRTGSTAAFGMTAPFDDVSLERLRRRRTVKWTLYGPDVLAAWVAEMDFDVAPAVRAAIVDAVDREDFGYVMADLGALTTACAAFIEAEYGWMVPPARIFPVADVLS